MNKKFIYHNGIITLSLCISLYALAHDDIYHDKKDNSNPRGVEVVNFNAQHISRVITAGYPVSFGVYAFTRREKANYLTLKETRKPAIKGDNSQEHQCVKANFLAFDIADDYAFDIDETISIEFLIDRAQTPSVVYGYDKHGSEKANGIVDLATYSDNEKTLGMPLIKNSSDLVWINVQFDHARFANRGINGTDFVLTTNETMLAESQLTKNAKTTLVLCDVKISRTNKEVDDKNSKEIQIKKVTTNFTFVDGNSDTPVRLGLYDSNGSAVLLENTGVVLPYYEDKSQHHSLPAFYSSYQHWPHDNRYFSYVDGTFNQALAPDTYTLIATKGPEYRISKQQFTVPSIENELNINIKLDRWQNLPAKGWYSGDVHIHIERAQNDNKNLAKVFQAEGLHFSNLLEMSTTEVDHFKQYSFGELGKFSLDDYHIVPGVEGPRTAHRGHAIALNIAEKFSSSNSFFLYHQYFDHYQQQQAVIGYAHVGSREFNASLGLALDMPFGLIDFVEVMQSQRLRTDLWYEFLNLGFKLAPAAGSDYPYFEQPGAVRSYVHLENKPFNTLNKKLNSDTWFAQLKGGNTFVTNLPVIDMTVNQQSMGSTLRVFNHKTLDINAEVSINSDFDRLAQVELIYCGQVIKQFEPSDGANETLIFNHQMESINSGWLALRVKGVNYALAHTGAIYLEDKAGSSACKQKAPAIITNMLKRLDKLENLPLNINKELEYWEAHKLEQALNNQKNDLNQRIDLAREFYHKMKMALLNDKN